MVKIGLFGRRTEEQSAPTAVGTAHVVDRDRDGVDDRDEARHRAEAREERLVDRDGDSAVYAGHTAQDKPDADRNRTGTAPAIDRDRDGVDDRVEARPTGEPAKTRFRARASMLATFALLIGLTSVYAALTGRLAPAAVALGVLGLLLSFGGLSATGRPRVAGSGLAILALLLSVGGAVLGVLAMNHVAPWLDSDIDQVARWRDWLDTNLPFIRGW